MADKTLGATRRILTNLKYVKVTPWTDEATLGSDTYQIKDIVGDTTTIDQEDNDVTEVENEFGKEPLYENVVLGKHTVSMDCINFESELLKLIYGWTIDEAGNAFAPASYKDFYAKIEFGFNSSDDIVVLPKVKMNGKTVFGTMKTDVAKGTISGSCYAAWVKAGSSEEETDMAAIVAANATDYTVSATKSIV